MDYEKAYKEALERAKEWHDDQHITIGLKGNLEEIFPILKESEDERIRKELLEHCINRRDGRQVCVDASDYRRWADWLEKQGEQKPDWNEYDMVVINAIYNTLKHCNVTKCGLEVTEMLEWLEELEKQGKHTNPIEIELSNSSIWSEGRPIYDGIYLVTWRGSRCLYHRGKATGYAVERVIDGHFYLNETEDLSAKQWVLIKKDKEL